VSYECIQYILLDYIRLNMSESENAVGFVCTGCRCGLVSGCGKTLHEGKAMGISRVVRPDVAWRACYKSADTLGSGHRIGALE
jgi:hypothetical protein